MNNQYDDQYVNQEIDLVDIVAVLYRRKAALFIVVAICIAASIAFWSTIKGKTEITMAFETGRNGTVLVMDPEDSITSLSGLYMPRHTLAADFPDIDEDNYAIVGTGMITVRAAASSEPVIEKLQVAINGAFEDLLAMHNKLLDTFLQSSEKTLIAKNLQLDAVKVLNSSPETQAIYMSNQYELEARIVALQNQIYISTPSTISNIITTNTPPSRGVLVFIFAGLALGVFCGCGLVFFLELLSQAKSRVAETN